MQALQNTMPSWLDRAAVFHTQEITRHDHNAAGEQTVTGTPALTATQSFPKAFADEVARLWTIGVPSVWEHAARFEDLGAVSSQPDWSDAKLEGLQSFLDSIA